MDRVERAQRRVRRLGVLGARSPLREALLEGDDGLEVHFSVGAAAAAWRGAARLFLPWMRWARRGREDASAGAAREVVGAINTVRSAVKPARAAASCVASACLKSPLPGSESVAAFLYASVASEPSCAGLVACSFGENSFC